MSIISLSRVLSLPISIIITWYTRLVSRVFTPAKCFIHALSQAKRSPIYPYTVEVTFVADIDLVKKSNVSLLIFGESIWAPLVQKRKGERHRIANDSSAICKRHKRRTLLRDSSGSPLSSFSFPLKLRSISAPTKAFASFSLRSKSGQMATKPSF